MLSSSLFLSRPSFLLSNISKSYQNNPPPYHRFCCTVICNFSIAIIVSQVTVSHDLHKNTANVGKKTIEWFLKVKPGNDTIFSHCHLNIIIS